MSKMFVMVNALWATCPNRNREAAAKNKTAPLAGLNQLWSFLLTRYVQGGPHGKVSILLKTLTLHSAEATCASTAAVL